MRVPSPLPFASLAALAATLACTQPRLARFADQDVVVEVTDSAPIPLPKRQLFLPLTYADALGRRPLVNALDPRLPRRAEDVNALDQVPPSSWFVKPAGGPLGAVLNVVSGPPVPPLNVIPRLPESGRNGLVVIDARGLRYELGRDLKDRPAMLTTAAAVATNLVRAVGYRTPEVTILSLAESDLRVEPFHGAPAPFRAVRDFLDEGPPPANGRYRASATRWPIGIDVGTTSPADPREDDPNDKVPHEDRRTLRALKLMRAWLKFPHFGVASLRDVYVGPPGKGHLQHYVLGLEGAIGAEAARSERQEPRSKDPEPDPTAGESGLALLLTFGLLPRVRRGDPAFPTIGDFDETVKDDDYERGQPFEPMDRMLPDDAYWAARRMKGVTREVIQAAVDAAAIEDFATRTRLVEILDKRRLAVVARAFAAVTPLEVVRVEGDEIALNDEGFSSKTPAKFSVHFVSDSGASLVPAATVAPPGAVFTVKVPRAPYVVLRVRATRGSVVAPRDFEAHFRPRGAGMRLVGVRH